METYTEWDNWKSLIRKAVNLGKTVGMEEETIAGIGAKIGDVLEERFDPENPQQRVIKEMWEVSNEQEQKSLARIIAKMVTEEKEEAGNRA